MITFKQVTKSFGVTTAVENISFHINQGETFGLIGTSGCGKTTTLRMMNRLIEPTAGSIFIDGTDTISQDPELLRRKMGYVIQNIGLFPHYTVQENVSTVPRLLEWEEQRIRSRCSELLEMVGLDPATYSDRKPASLSGGQQQRVGLARALASDPPILLMDEPFGALDPITKRQIRREVRQLLEQMQKTIVLVTHDIFEAFEMCDRLCLLDQGHIQQIGTPQELLFQPANDFTQSFFASNRFQLELLSIAVSDILDSKDSGSNASVHLSEDNETHREVSPDLSLYNLLETMEQSAAETPRITIHTGSGIKESLDFTALMNRFQQVTRQLKSGRSDD